MNAMRTNPPCRAKSNLMMVSAAGRKRTLTTTTMMSSSVICMVTLTAAAVILQVEPAAGGRTAGGRSLEYAAFDPRRFFEGRLGSSVLAPPAPPPPPVLQPPPPKKSDPRKRKGKRTNFVPPKKQSLFQAAFVSNNKDPGFYLKPPGPNAPPPRLAELRSLPPTAEELYDPAAEFVAGSFILTQRALDEAPYRYSSFLTKVILNLLINWTMIFNNNRDKIERRYFTHAYHQFYLHFMAKY